MLSFAELTADPFPCYPVTQNIAEKLHALTQPRLAENSRLKDLIDVLLLAGLDSTIQADRLRASVEAVFNVREDNLPSQFGPVPQSWQTRFRSISRDLELPYETLEKAAYSVSEFIDPILTDTVAGIWKPESWGWEVEWEEKDQPCGWSIFRVPLRRQISNYL